MKRSLALLCSAFLAQSLAAAAPERPAARVLLSEPRWAMSLKAGAALPLGDLAQFNAAGPAACLDLLYHASAAYSVDSFISYSTQGYKLGGGSLPLSNAGLGVKALYNMMTAEESTWYLGLGVAAYYNQRTKQILRPVINNAPPVFDPVPSSSFGLGGLAVLGAHYQDPRGWGLILELNFVNINLAGGTSDSLFLAQPMLGVSYEL